MKGLSKIVSGGDNKLFSMNADKELQITALLSNMQDNAYNFFSICGNRNSIIFVKAKREVVDIKAGKI